MSAIYIPRRARPSWATGFARSQSDARFPGLWDGLQANYAPSLGATGGALFDVSGRQNHGAITGATWENGGLSFLGSDNVQLPLILNDQIKQSMSIRIRWRHNGNSNDGHFFDNRLSSDDGYDFQIHNSQVIQFTIDNGADTILTASISGLPVGVYECVATYGDTEAKLYLHGDLIQSEPYSGEVAGSSQARLGNNAGGGNPLGNNRGLIQTSIYNRALAPSEIQLLHTRGLAGYNAILERKSRVYPVATAAPPAGLDIPIAMHHYTKNITAA